MRKNLIKILVISCAVFYGLCVSGFAQSRNVNPVKRWWRKIINKNKKDEKNIQKPQVPYKSEGAARPVPVKEPTKEEKINILNNNLEIYGDEIAGKIDALIKSEDENRKPVYKFKKESGEIVDFKDLDEKDFDFLYKRVVNEAVLIRSERLNRQLEQIRQSIRPPAISAPPTPAVQPPKMPAVHTAPPRIPLPPPPVVREQRR